MKNCITALVFVAALVPALVCPAPPPPPAETLSINAIGTMVTVDDSYWLIHGYKVIHVDFGATTDSAGWPDLASFRQLRIDALVTYKETGTFNSEVRTLRLSLLDEDENETLQENWFAPTGINQPHDGAEVWFYSNLSMIVEEMGAGWDVIDMDIRVVGWEGILANPDTDDPDVATGWLDVI